MALFGNFAEIAIIDLIIHKLRQRGNALKAKRHLNHINGQKSTGKNGRG
jgi:hypothetical protein